MLHRLRALVADYIDALAARVRPSREADVLFVTGDSPIPARIPHKLRLEQYAPVIAASGKTEGSIILDCTQEGSL